MSPEFTSGTTSVRRISSTIGGRANFQHPEIVAAPDGIFFACKILP
jgi:hypothetical protein